MRMARSTSPRRRNSAPRANCSSTVCGFSLATCRKDSMALSGCSFSRKLRPRKYEEGSARDSESSDFRSMRAATHPMPKNTGRASSHQNSNSMDVRRRLDRARRFDRPWRFRRRGSPVDEVLGVAPQPRELAPLAHHRGDPREQPDHHARDEDDEQHEDERRLPRLARQAKELDLLAVLDREPDEHDDDEEAN